MAFAGLPMDGTPSLKAVADEIDYLSHHVYNNPLVSINVADPPKQNGQREWLKLKGFIAYLPDTPIRLGLMNTYADRLSCMPPDVETGRTILSNMHTTVMQLYEILCSHGKGNPEKPDLTFQDPDGWLLPHITPLGLNDVKAYQGSTAIDGHAVRVGKQFYAKHQASLRLEPLEMNDMKALIQQEGAVARIAKMNGTTLGFYICQRRGEVLRVLEWVMSSHMAASERGVPERMVADMLYDLSPFAVTNPKITRIESAITETHRKTEEPQATEGSWLTRPALF